MRLLLLPAAVFLLPAVAHGQKWKTKTETDPMTDAVLMRAEMGGYAIERNGASAPLAIQVVCAHDTLNVLLRPPAAVTTIPGRRGPVTGVEWRFDSDSAQRRSYPASEDGKAVQASDAKPVATRMLTSKRLLARMTLADGKVRTYQYTVPKDTREKLAPIFAMCRVPLPTS
jgi:hypothetical protein